MKKIRLSKSFVGEEEKSALSRVIDAGYLGMGVEVQLFEKEIKDYLKTSNEVICVGSGTAALHLALQAIGVGPGDEVLVPTITYLATFQAVSATGAKPIACDVTKESVFIDLEDAAKRLTIKTKAILPVHYGSNSEGMVELKKFADKYNIRIIEDAAHSFGCESDGNKVGAFGDITCFSFDGIKNITSGEGGAVVTGDLEVAKRVKDSRLLGVEKDTEKRYLGERSWEFNVSSQGWRYHMSNLMAAIGREQLKKVEEFSRARKKVAELYTDGLLNLENITLFKFNYSNIVPHIFPLRITNGLRDKIRGELANNSIECGIHYSPNHLLSLYRTEYTLPKAEALYGELLSLPMHVDLVEADIRQIINIIVKAIDVRKT